MIDRPNVVVIVADTFRRDHLGAYGNPRIRTPYLDELARSSVVFDNHVVSSFPTMPARADILTGTFSYAHMGWEPLPQHLMTLPELLSSAGYLTMGVGHALLHTERLRLRPRLRRLRVGQGPGRRHQAARAG